MTSWSWSVGDQLYRTVDTQMLDAVKALDGSRRIRGIEDSLRSTDIRSLLDHQRDIEQWARESVQACDSVRALLDDRQRLEHLAALAWKNAAQSAAEVTAVIYSTEAKLHRSLCEATKAVENEPKWAEMQQAIAHLSGGDLVLPWNDIKRLADTMSQEAFTVRQLFRVFDFDKVLGVAMTESAHAAWSTHLRTMALPTLSFLAQDWLKPVGLMTDLGSSDLGASISWVTRYRSEAVVMTAAVTPELGSPGSPEVVIDDEIVCALCGGPILNFDGDVRWIGPHRAIRRRLIFPTCSTCWTKEGCDPGFLYRALCELTRPRFAVIRGGGRGNGRPHGRLHLVQNQDD